MPAIEVLKTSHDTDLRPFAALLWQQGIAHRIHEEADELILSVAEPALVERVLELYSDWQSGEVKPQAKHPGFSLQVSDYWLRVILRSPVTVALLLLAIPGAIIGIGNFDSYQQWLTFAGYTRLANLTFTNPLSDTLSGEFWRLITPIFLHFSLLHITFNAVFIWVFGHRIEILQGHSRLLWLVLFIGVGSNYAQYLMSPGAIFGGLSGVLYGLVGYLWGWRLLRPDEQFGIPTTIIYAIVALMVLTATGVFTLVLGNVANTAHIVGLGLGVLMGLLLAALRNRAGVV